MLRTILRGLLKGEGDDGEQTPESSLAKLHLGCGSNIMPGWVNVDIQGLPGTLALDLTQPLPLPDKSIRMVYSEHFIEHVTRPQAVRLLSECRRVLADDGILRISTPNLAEVIDAYRTGRLTDWSDVGYVAGTRCQLINDAMRLWGHQFLYDEAEFDLLLQTAGFRSLRPVQWRQSEIPELQNLECRPFHGEIIREARP